MSGKIQIKGARTHNLKNIDLEIPRDKFVVITGLSGSGKSSLAFDTLYAEGQRRYVESLSAYARQFLGMMEKPDVDSIEGLSPAISIDQKSTSKNPRSTVGTITEIYDYLRLLFARIGHAYCPQCQTEISGQSQEQIVEQIIGRGDVVIAAPLIRGRKGQHKQLFADLLRDGYTRVFLDGEIVLLEDVGELDKNKKHDISLVIDRVSASRDNKSRLAHDVSLAVERGEGLVEVFRLEGERIALFSQNNACPTCSYALPELEPRLFSFNSPQGACATCQGLGLELQLSVALLLGDQSKSIADGVLDNCARYLRRYDKRLLEAVCDTLDQDIAWRDLSDADRNKVLFGTTEKFDISYVNRFGKPRRYKNIAWTGILSILERRSRESRWQKEVLSKYLSEKPCSACLGARLCPEALSVRVADKNIAQASALDISDLSAWLDLLSLSRQEEEIASLLLAEIKNRVRFLLDVGLDYLSLDRGANTLSGGESQRIRLATQIGSRLVGVLYILDEPSIGLHPSDNDKLLQTLASLRDLGNTLLVVEHDEATMNSADWIIDVGPGAGLAGGEIVAAGTPAQIKKSKSLTGSYLAGSKKIATPTTRRRGQGELVLRGASSNNLASVDARFRVGAFNCITGVSGSGKSTLVTDTLYPALANGLHKTSLPEGRYDEIEGMDLVDKVIAINQSPIGRTPRSNPATYTGLFDPIRSLFAQTRKAKELGYKPGRFSFNLDGGRCETCRGDGEIKIEMHFLPDVYIVCQDCSGARYNQDTLEIEYSGKNIAEVLDMSVEEARQFFSSVGKIRRRLQTLSDVGLGYIKLGQPATTLSGGEAQRIKLATELSRVATGDTVYILDEPTTGLHFADVEKLLSVLQRLVDAGNTVVVIEHNIDVIKSADWILDLGPGGGKAGGKIIASGSPEKIARSKRSLTGSFLS